MERGFLNRMKADGIGSAEGYGNLIPGYPYFKEILDPRANDLSVRFNPPEDPNRSGLEVTTKAGKKIFIPANWAGGMFSKLDPYSETSRNIIIYRIFSISSEVGQELLDSKQVDRFWAEVGEKRTKAAKNFNRMQVAFFRSLDKKEDAYSFGAFMRWLINYNNELGGTIENIHPTVYNMMERVIW